MTLEAFVEKAKNIHGNKYDYSNVVFVSMNCPIDIECPKHGIFSQKPSVHINDKCGCPICGKERQGKSLGTEEFIKRAQEIHGERYDYSKAVYTTAHTDVIIYCPKHDLEFFQRPDAHIFQKQKCPKCGIEERLLPHKKTTEQFIREAKQKWADRYIYTNTIYDNKNVKIIYECPKHGVIAQKPTLHIRHGCPYCNGRGISRHSTETFINIATKIHNNLYDYSSVRLNKITDYIDITCRKHGIFTQRANNHIHLQNGCPQCDVEKTSSKAEKELVSFIKEHYSGVILENDRNVLKGKEIDAYLPGLKLGFEYHGMYWHTETVYGKKNHWKKANLANSAGIRLIQIYENEWVNKKEIIKSKIMCLLGKVSRRIFARKTVLRPLSTYEKDVFLDATHIQGKDGSTISYGLFSGTELVACMSFGTSRFNRKYDWELVRYSSAKNAIVVGGAAKLLKHFMDNNKGSIISYADRRYSAGNLYHKLGFVLDGITKPSFCYFHISSGKVFNRMKFQKKSLVGMKGYDKDLKEYEIMQINGYDRIWDAGQYRFVLGAKNGEV